MIDRFFQRKLVLVLVAGGMISSSKVTGFMLRPLNDHHPLELNDCTSGFSFACQQFLRIKKSELSLARRKKENHPEYSVVEDGDDDIVESGTSLSNDVSLISTTSNSLVEQEDDSAQTSHSDRGEQQQLPRRRPEYAALAPGTVVQVEIGDLGLARKAWKKRRRSASPLLVPCSVLNVDRQSMVRWNLIFLLQKFGRPKKDGIEIRSSELVKQFRKFLKSPLPQHATALGYESTREMLLALFDKQIQEQYGVRLVVDDDGIVTLKAPISRFKAHKYAVTAPLLQFRPPHSDELHHDDGDDVDVDPDTLIHTGYVRARVGVSPSEEQRGSAYRFLPLSAALRVSQKDDIDSGNVKQGSIHTATVFNYDIAGDGGSPLLTLSLKPGAARQSLKMRPEPKYMPIDNPQLYFKDLSVGDGPYRAKVIRFLKEPKGVMVDCDVGRPVPSSKDNSMVKVFGTLRFKDSVEVVGKEGIDDFPTMEFMGEDEDEDDVDEANDTIESLFGDSDGEEEEEIDGESIEDALLSLRESSSFEEGTFEEGEEIEDITDQFKMNADGTLSYTDPNTGEKITLDDGDEISNEISNTSQREESMKTVATPMANESRSKRLKSKRLKLGDIIEVYVRSVSKQNGQFTVTTNADAVKGKKGKEIKKEEDAQKKLARLEKKLGGSLERIWALEGEECDGTVRATSQAGDWVYVQPDLSGLPVGVAAMTNGNTENGSDKLVAGDAVRIRLMGIDEKRGQLAMQVIGKLSP